MAARERPLFLGAGVTYARIMRELPGHRTRAGLAFGGVAADPQPRDRGRQPRDGLARRGRAARARRRDARGRPGEGGRFHAFGPVEEFLTGVKQTAREPGELILGARWNVPTGPGSFSKIGTRNAMVIAVANLVRSWTSPRARCGSRSARSRRRSFEPKAQRPCGASTSRLRSGDDPGCTSARTRSNASASLVAEAANPIDDVRGTSVYRRHAVEVMARRAFGWALADRAAG